LDTADIFLPPCFSTISSACSRVKRDNFPVNKKVFPAKLSDNTSVDTSPLSSWIPYSFSLSISFLFSSLEKNAAMLSAILSPISSTWMSSSTVALLSSSIEPKFLTNFLAMVSPMCFIPMP